MSLWRSSSRRFRYRYSRVLTRRPKLSYCGGGDGDLQEIRMLEWQDRRNMGQSGIPIAISRDNLVDPQFLADLLNAQVQGVSLELLVGHIGHNHRGKAHQA